MKAKKFFANFSLCAFIICIWMGIHSCKEKAVINNPGPTVTAYLTSRSDLSILSLALGKTGLDKVFNSGDNVYTLFAPDDSAFMAAGYTKDSLNRLSSSDTSSINRLSTLLKNHIVFGEIAGINLVAFFHQALVTLNPAFQPIISKNYYGLFINGIKVQENFISVSNGSVQVIGRLVLSPTQGSVYQLIHSRMDQTYMAALIDIIHNYKYYLNYPGDPVTFLSPSDSAWKGYGFASIDSFKSSVAQDSGYYISVFNNMFGGGAFYTNDFLGAATDAGAETALPGYFPPGSSFFLGMNNAVFTIDGRHIDQGYDIPSPYIIVPDIPATNGVLHIIDRVPNPR